MPDLEQIIGQLTDRALAALRELHDDYVCTRMLWRDMFVRVTRYDENPTIVNSVTGNTVDGVALAFNARLSMRRMRIRAYKDLVVQYELFLAELIRVWLAKHTQSLSGKSVTIGTILSTGDLAAVQAAAIEEAIQAAISDKLFGRPEKWFNYLRTLFGSEGGIVQSRQVDFGELKARRDVLEHHDGKVESIYIDKAKTASKYAAGDVVEITNADVDEAYSLVRDLIVETKDWVLRSMQHPPQ
jgi:hypothetical protein